MDQILKWKAVVDMNDSYCMLGVEIATEMVRGKTNQGEETVQKAKAGDEIEIGKELVRRDTNKGE